MADPTTTINGWERSLIAAEKVRERCRRAARALDDAGVLYAVAGGNAVAEWVGRVDEGAIRNTPDVDIMIHRADFPAARSALETVGFIYHQLLDIATFIDGPTGRPRSGVHLLFAGEKAQATDEHPAPGLDQSERAADFQVTLLEALVRMKLIAYRNKDRMHLYDLIGVGLVDATWPARLPPPLGERLQQLLDNPNG